MERVEEKIKAQVVGLTTVVLENGDVIVMQVSTPVVHRVVDQLDANGRPIYEVEPNLAIGFPAEPICATR